MQPPYFLHHVVLVRSGYHSIWKLRTWHIMITVIFRTESEYHIILNVCQMSTNVMIAECVQMCRTELKYTRMSANIRKCEPHMVDPIKCYLACCLMYIKISYLLKCYVPNFKCTRMSANVRKCETDVFCQMCSIGTATTGDSPTFMWKNTHFYCDANGNDHC